MIAPWETPNAAVDPEQVVIWAESVEAFAAAMDELGEQNPVRALLARIHFYHGIPSAQLAPYFEMSPQMARYHVREAKKHLRKRLRHLMVE